MNEPQFSPKKGNGCFTFILGLFGFYIIFIFSNSIYYRMSHLNKEDLKWADAYTFPDSAFFKSDKGNIARLIVNEKKIWNSRIPFGANQWVHGSDYNATIYFDFKVDKMEGFFFLIKSAEDNSIEFRLNLNYLFFTRRDYKPRTFALNGVTYDNCIIVNKFTGKNNDSPDNPTSVTKFVWSQKHGLIYYEFKNGEKYSLIPASEAAGYASQDAP